EEVQEITKDDLKKETDSESDGEPEDELNEQPLSTQNSDYFEEELEYARVWLQVTGHTGVDKVTAYKIKAGEPVSSMSDESVAYPHDVVRLGGDMTADGIITYRKASEGTIEL